MINKEEQTSFIEFLGKTFSFGELALKTEVDKSFKLKEFRPGKEKREEKSGFYESTKLKKVLSIFIEHEEAVREDRDDKKAREWKRAIVAKRLAMHNNKKKKEKQNCKLMKLLYSVRERSVKEKKQTIKSLLFRPWPVGVVSACLAALIFSVSIVCFNPDTADRIACNADKAIINIGKALYIILATADIKGLEEINSNKTPRILTKEMRADFIFKNKEELKGNFNADNTLRLTYEDVAGRVAGMVEKNYDYSGISHEKNNLSKTGLKGIVKVLKRFIDNLEINY